MSNTQKKLYQSFCLRDNLRLKIFVSGDKDVEEGSAIIETSNGVIDANISTQLDLIKEAFKQI